MSMWETEHLANGSAKPVVDKEKISLYNMRFCPYAERTVLVLLAKNIDFVNINIDLKKKPDWFVNSTLGKVPVLLHKGNIIPESLITCDYLDEVYPETKLHPSDPLQKALDRVVVEKVGAMMGSLRHFIIGSPLTDDEKVERFANVIGKMKDFNDEIASRNTPFLGGDLPCMADYMIWPFFERIVCLPNLYPNLKEELTIPSELSSLSNWIEAMRSTEPVKKYGFSPERMAKITEIHKTTGGYDDALAQTVGA